MTTYKAEPYFNTRGLAMLDGWKPGDVLVTSKDAELMRLGLTVEGDSPEAACEQVFAALNADDRPNGQVERSLSVGDVVCLVVEGDAPYGTAVTTWSVQSFGFAPVPRHKVFSRLLEA